MTPQLTWCLLLGLFTHQAESQEMGLNGTTSEHSLLVRQIPEENSTVSSELPTDDLTESTNTTETESVATDAATPQTDELKESTTTMNPREPFKCKFEGYFNDPEDCTKFYRCVRVGYLQTLWFDCAPGTVFEETLSVCVHPWQSHRPECRGQFTDPGTERSTTVNSTTGRGTTVHSIGTSTNRIPGRGVKPDSTIFHSLSALFLLTMV